MLGGDELNRKEEDSRKRIREGGPGSSGGVALNRVTRHLSRKKLRGRRVEKRRGDMKKELRFPRSRVFKEKRVAKRHCACCVQPKKEVQ